MTHDTMTGSQVYMSGSMSGTARAIQLPPLGEDAPVTVPVSPDEDTRRLNNFSLLDKASKWMHERDSRDNTNATTTMTYTGEERDTRSRSKSTTEGGSDMEGGSGTEIMSGEDGTGNGNGIGGALMSAGGKSAASGATGQSSGARRRAMELKAKAKKARAGMRSFFKPRRRVTALFMLLEAVGLLIYWVVVTKAGDNILGIYKDSVSELMPVSEFFMGLKVNQIKKGYSRKAANEDIISFLQTGNASLLTDIQTTLEFDLEARQIELSLLLNPDMVVVATGNYNTSMIGQTFDPFNVVTLARHEFNSSGTTQVSRNALVTVNELYRNQAPKWCERVVITNPALAGRHPYDTNEGGLIRYTTTAVVEPNTTELLGFLIAGDLITGKMGSSATLYESQWHAEDTTIEDGFVAIFRKQSDYEETQGTSKISSQAWVSATKAGMIRIPTYSDVTALLVEGKPFSASSFGFMDHALELAAGNEDDYYISARGDVVAHITDKNTGYTFAAAHVNRLGWTSDDEAFGVEDVDAVMVRGTHASAYVDATLYSWAFIVGMMIMEAITLLLVMMVFLSPLEEMGKRIRMGGKLDHKNMAKLLARRNLMGGILLWNCSTLIVAIALMVWTVNLTDKAILMRTRSDPSTIVVTFNTKVAQMRLVSFRLAQEDTFRRIATAASGNQPSYSSDDLTDANTLLTYEMLTVLKADLAAVLDTDFRVIVMANNSVGDVNSTYLDPLGLATTCMSQNDPVIGYGVLHWDTYKRFNILVSHDHLNTAESSPTPDSNLHPTVDNPLFLARVVVTPLYAADDDVQRYPAAFMMVMDIVNGHTSIGEQALELFGRQEGYNAIFIYDDDTDSYQLAMGIIMHKGVNVEVDVDLSDRHKRELLETVRVDPLTIGTISGVDFYGEKHYLSATCLLNDFVMRDEAKEYINLTRTTCPAFLVQSMPESLVEHDRTMCKYWQILGLIVQVIKLICVVLLCRYTYKPFKEIVVKALAARPKGKAAGSKGSTPNQQANISTVGWSSGGNFTTEQGKCSTLPAGTLKRRRTSSLLMLKSRFRASIQAVLDSRRHTVSPGGEDEGELDATTPSDQQQQPPPLGDTTTTAALQYSAHTTAPTRGHTQGSNERALQTQRTQRGNSGYSSVTFQKQENEEKDMGKSAEEKV